ncbi:aspartate/glutamate racemase [Gammaproteobacteria bacterium]|nr:aspartate/glutamate racemase [Gammaproteobacteria bacterium]
MDTMKTIGIIGGMSPESTELYYKIINKTINQRLGSHHNAQIILISVNFEIIKQLQINCNWQEAGVILADAAYRLQQAGADFILLATNTMHKVAAQIESAVTIPFIHLADATASCIKKQNIKKIGLLGTYFTMSDDFYKERLIKQNISVIVPDEITQTIIHNIIFDELCLGKIEESSRKIYLDCIDKLVRDGAEAIILGCTEITLLIDQSHTQVRLFDTTAIHALCAVDLALA